MIHLRLIFIFYLFLTLFALISPISISIFKLAIALLLMWLIYWVYYKSSKQRVRVIKKNVPFIKYDRYKSVSFFIFLFALFFIPIYVKFYTGSNIVKSVMLFLSGASQGNSTYVNYQNYFKYRALYKFTVAKLPYIIGAGILKFLFWSILIRILAFKETIKWYETVILFSFFILYFAIGAARGTSFEIFELLTLLIFGSLLRIKRLNNKNWFSKRTTMLILTGIVLGFLLFLFTKSLRYGGQELITNPTTDLKFNYDSIFAEYFPHIAIAIHNLTGYFIFGLFFTSVAISTIWNTPLGFLSALVPFGLIVFGFGTSYETIICNNIIDCGASWIPDVIQLIGTFGLIILLLFIRWLGKISQRLYNEAIYGNILSAIILYSIFFFFISLPIGNFIATSSSNQLAIIFAITIYLLPLKSNLKNYYKIK